MKKKPSYFLLFISLFIINPKCHAAMVTLDSVGIMRIHSKSVELSQTKDIEIIQSFLKELTDSNFEGRTLYNKYFYIAKAEKPDRSKEDIEWYTDTLFFEMRGYLSKNSVEVYKLADARSKFKNDSLANYYYDTQKHKIFVIAINMGDRFIFYYCLVAYRKIISLWPYANDENEMMWWR